MKVAVIAHTGKTMGGGLPELRRCLRARGIDAPLWYEVTKSKRAPAVVRRALADGADVVFSWGGDGLARRCIGELAGTSAALAILPAGTSNLLATSLGIPTDVEGAVAAGLDGERRALDVGRFKGERFAVMAGAGLDAAMIRDADSLKDRLGRAAYVWSTARNLRQSSFGADIRVDGARWHRGQVTCILVGNIGTLFGGIEVFPGAEPDDGRLNLGIVTADGVVDWARILARTAVGDPARSPFVQVTTARKIQVKLDRKVLYELDGGDRRKVRSFSVKVQPGVLTVCTPASPPVRDATTGDRLVHPV